MVTFQEIIQRLNRFWEEQGCCIHHGYDIECGAGTFNPVTFLRCLGPEPYKGAYVEPSRRPTDGRYGTNPNRVQQHHQYQVILKPSPSDIQNVYLQSLEAVGFDLSEHDMRFVHDDWESPTLGAWGLGWEAWMDGMEVTQITYFQCFGGIDVKPVTGELTYGLERLAMYLQKVDNIFDIKWNDQLTYGDIFHQNEVEWSHYNFEQANTEMWFKHFNDYEKEAKEMLEKGFPIPAYDFIAKASHAFNILDARGVISVTERTGYISRIRNLARQVAEGFIESREKLGFPLKRLDSQAKTLPAIPPIVDLPPSLDHETFILEIGSEELPATFVPIGLKNLEQEIAKFLDGESIKYDKIQTYGTPRRLALSIQGLATSKPTKTTVRKGPPLDRAYDEEDNITPTGEGFFRSVGIDSPPSRDSVLKGEFKEIDVREVKGVHYLYVTVSEPAKPTIEILAEQLPKLILNLNFPKKMRWANLDISYARPIIWILALFGNRRVPFVVGEILSDNKTHGHRQLNPQIVELKHAADYVESLRNLQVMVDVEERKKSILEQISSLEKEIKATVIEKERVIPQVLHLVEWPRVTYAEFDPLFLRAPKELLISEMVEHQKYFPVADEKGNLKNYFIITANNHPTGSIRNGNRKVLSARLSDGLFLYEQDLKSSLDAFNKKLAHITFQKELGTVWEKVERLEKHVATLHQLLPLGKVEDAKRAAHYCKSDLASGAVYEFPELQGTMGKYYALAQGENGQVAAAIVEHWMPTSEQAPLPESAPGTLLSLADKIDNLIGCFSVGLKPTSSSDPYALRRQVLGLIKMLISGNHPFPIREAIKQCFQNFPSKFRQNEEEVLQEILEFITNRIKTVFQDYGVNKDEIEASISFGVADIYDSYCRVKALHDFRETNRQFPLLYEVFKRAKGQINAHQALSFSKKLLKEKAEIDLDDLLTSSQDSFDDCLETRNYAKAYIMIAEIQPKLGRLFDEVKILADEEEIKNNRIALLQRVFERFSRLLDFNKIQQS